MTGRPKGSKEKSRPSGDGPVMTVVEVSEYLRVHRTTVYRMIKANQIPYFRIGGDYRFDRVSIDAWTKRGN
jgi:excisionase family DNA binding protein